MFYNVEINNVVRILFGFTFSYVYDTTYAVIATKRVS